VDDANPVSVHIHTTHPNIPNMNDLSPCLDCTLHCRFYANPMCVSNLVFLADELTPITLGLHIGLNHVYGDEGLPPCVHGPIGSAHWSIHRNAQNPGSPRPRAASAA
jgi:hypothetical protein